MMIIILLSLIGYYSVQHSKRYCLYRIMLLCIPCCGCVFFCLALRDVLFPFCHEVMYVLPTQAKTVNIWLTYTEDSTYVLDQPDNWRTMSTCLRKVVIHQLRTLLDLWVYGTVGGS